MTKERELDIKMYTEANYLAKVFAEDNSLPLLRESWDMLEITKTFKDAGVFDELIYSILEKALYIRYHSEEKE